MFATDASWARYVAAVKAQSTLDASLWAVALFVLGAVAVIGYTRDRWLLVPGALGAFAGTFVGVAWNL